MYGGHTVAGIKMIDCACGKFVQLKIFQDESIVFHGSRIETNTFY